MAMQIPVWCIRLKIQYDQRVSKFRYEIPNSETVCEYKSLFYGNANKINKKHTEKTFTEDK